MERLSDMEYVERVQAGDAECFAPLLERYSQPVFSLLMRIVGNREDAEELTQDVFLKVFRSLSSFRGNSSFATWLYRIAYNTAVSATRRTKREWMSFDDSGMERVAEETSDNEADETLNEDRLQRLEHALDRLRPDDRALILLFYKQEKTMEEIAEILREKTSARERLKKIEIQSFSDLSGFFFEKKHYLCPTFSDYF